MWKTCMFNIETPSLLPERVTTAVTSGRGRLEHGDKTQSLKGMRLACLKRSL